ncbi:hypothetical protein [Pseudomonas sp. RA_35y_Pfl2_P32]
MRCWPARLSISLAGWLRTAASITLDTGQAELDSERIHLAVESTLSGRF